MNSSSAILTVDLGAVAHNYNLLKSKCASGCKVAGVVKADAYGLGMEKVWAALESNDCPFYFVATFGEALRLRALTRKPVAVLNGMFGVEIDDAIHRQIMPVINSLASVADWKAAAAKHQIPLPVILHFDTGMNRLGMGADETAKLLSDTSLLKGLDVKVVMSHFSCADEEGHPATPQQYDRFTALTGEFPKAVASLANSSGIFGDVRYHFGMVRPGMAVYGLNPTPETSNPMRPVVTLETRILQTRRAKKGEAVGYGASHTLKQDSTLATVALGYADGFLRSLSGKGTLYYKNKPCPILGRVSMDLTVIDMDGADAKPGEMVEVLGPNQSADQLAAAAGTIGYEILTSLGPRYKRVYKG
ncbi:MAG TPA: alanine racemase [Patescibacteria group bacterium]|nr:alanine racemase [Patescibacteria group bacterium]